MSGSMHALVFAPLIPIALWVALAACGAVLLVWYALAGKGRLPRRRWMLTVGMMALAIALPLGILLNPTWLETIPPPAGKPLLTVLLDTSVSMTTADAGQGKTRFESARDIAETLSAELDSQYEVQLRAFDVSAAPVELQELAARRPEGEQSDIDAAVKQALQEDRPQGQAILLLSDGIHNSGAPAAELLRTAAKAKAMAAPIYAMSLGGKPAVKNLAARLASPQELAFVGQEIPVVVQIEQQGLAGRPVVVTLTQGDDEVARQEVNLEGDAATEIEFQLSQDRSGLFRYAVHAEPLADEVTPADNQATFLLRVVDEPIRVLLLEGKPYWDSKFLMRNLAADPSVELTSIVQLAEGRLLKRTLERVAPPSPVVTSDQEGANPENATGDAEKSPAAKVARPQRWEIVASAGDVLSDDKTLRGFQIVVLGRDAEVFLNDASLANLRRWIARDGGSLVCSRGPPEAEVSQRLARLMPVRWSRSPEFRFRIQFTDRGRQLRWLAGDGQGDDAVLAGMPSLAATAQATGAQPLAVVLASTVASEGGEAIPVVAYQPYGTGRVVVVEGAGMWRWAFLAPQFAKQEKLYSALWHSLTRWLVSRAALLPGQDVALQSEKVAFASTEPATATLLVREESGAVANIELRGEGLDEAKTFEPRPLGEDPGVYRVTFGELPEGRYEARVAGAAEDHPGAKTAFDVRNSWTERLDLDARPDLMARIAETSGGELLADAEPDTLAEQFRQHLARSRPERLRRTSAWDRAWVLLVVLGCWGATWGFRRASGLV